MTEEIARSPLGSAVKTKDDNAIAASKAIKHDESIAETLLIRAYKLCIVVARAVGLRYESLESEPSMCGRCLRVRLS